MIDKTDVVIVGGGINGCALAYELSLKGIDVAVIERSHIASGATGRCGAGIRQQWSAGENVALAIESVRIFERLEEELGKDIGLKQGGYLIAIHDEKDMEQAEKNVSMQRSLGLDVGILSPEEIREVVPILDVGGMDAIGATFCPTDGNADPFKTTYAYANAAMKHGAKIYKFTEVQGILSENGKVRGVKTNKGKITADVVVNAAGAWSRKIAEMAGVNLPNVPYKKEIMVTERVKYVFDPMVISFKDGIYFSQQEEGQILGGIPPPETVTGYEASPTLPFLEHMSRIITRYAPVLKHVNVLRQWTGFYDVTPDALPILGGVEGVNGFIQCNGFSGHGFMLSPMVTKLLAEMIAGEKPSMPIDRLNLKRFENMELDEREKYVVG